ncbi:MAG: ribonuclease P protein component [Alphaproteobacteria bacterium]|nr:ribonuclease P protein component [Alphaproteobacteria bacterium]
MRHDELGLVRLKRRADFLRVARTGRRFAAPGLVLQVAERKSAGRTGPNAGGIGGGVEATLGIGFTASKRVGNAVARNRAKRRLRAVGAEVMPRHAAAGHDYVLIGRQATLRRPFADLRADLMQALQRTRSLAKVPA